MEYELADHQALALGQVKVYIFSVFESYNAPTKVLYRMQFHPVERESFTGRGNIVSESAVVRQGKENTSQTTTPTPCSQEATGVVARRQAPHKGTEEETYMLLAFMCGNVARASVEWCS